MSSDHPPKSDKELWQSLALAPGAVSAVSEIDLAAWLEGRLDERDAARIEAAVVADADLRAAAVELSEVLGQPLSVAPARLLVRAQALVGFEAERQAAAAGSWFGGWLSFGIQRAVMATAAVIVAISGFMMGGGLGESFAQDRHATTSIGPAAGGVNELAAFFRGDGI